MADHGNLYSLLFLPNIRGGKYAYYGGYKFTLNRRRGKRFYWRCTHTRKCKGSIQTNEDVLLKVGAGIHEHPPMPHLYDIDVFRAKLMTRSRNELIPIPQIYDEELEMLKDSHYYVCNDLQKSVPYLDSIRSPMYRERMKGTASLTNQKTPLFQVDSENSPAENVPRDHELKVAVSD